MEGVHEASQCVCEEQAVLKAPTPPMMLCVCVCEGEAATPRFWDVETGVGVEVWEEHSSGDGGFI